MAAETETGFLIDGVLYEVPAIDSFNMDELQVLYDYSGLGLEDFAQSPDETEEEERERARVFKNPGLIRALMHVAYQRKHPKLPPAQVRKLVGSAKGLDVLAGLALVVQEVEEDEVPLASTSERNEPSPNGSLENEHSTPGSSESGGRSSTNSSDGQARTPVPITALRSGTSSPLSTQEISAS